MLLRSLEVPPLPSHSSSDVIAGLALVELTRSSTYSEVRDVVSMVLIAYTPLLRSLLLTQGQHAAGFQ